MIDSEDWQRLLGLGIVGAVPMVIVALLEKGMISGLMKKHTRTMTRSFFTLRLHGELDFPKKCD